MILHIVHFMQTHYIASLLLYVFNVRLLLAYLYMNSIHLRMEIFERLKIDLCLTEICFGLCAACRQTLKEKKEKNINKGNSISPMPCWE